ncbi:MAG: hypothetical protein Q8K02_05065 [Flavobacterium sp.]|nr:hypothetical protein [Flavobacterium sp.]
MKTITRLFLILLITGFYSCKQSEHQIVIEEEITKEQETDFQLTAVSLNEGQLWEANTETTQGIKNMQQLMADFSIDSGNSEELIVHLKDEFALIFKKCTMTGEAHEQLHNYLIPLKFKIESLSEGVTVEKTVDVKTYLDDYFNYFQ